VDARTPLGATPAAAQPDASTGPENGDDRLSTELSVLTRPGERLSVRYRASSASDLEQDARASVSAADALRAALAALDAGGEDPVDAPVLTGPETAADGWVSPDTQASLVAPYLDAWRRRIERLGTVNYPSIARAGTPAGNPVLEIELLASGTLRAVRVRRSSGSAELDAAALQILRLGNPFDPFPADMAESYPVLRFAYEWQFVRRGRLEVAPD
jgi:periplasmic protein TonB